MYFLFERLIKTLVHPIWFSFLLLTPMVGVNAFTPTPAQIQQFKNLSPSEQKALAQSMGIDISSLGDLGQTGSSTQSAEALREPVTGVRAPKQYEDELADIEVYDLGNKDDVTGEKDSLKPFGYDLFKFGAETFTPATSIPVPANYVLGPGDTLVIQLYGKESASYSLTLDRAGSIQFPEIGPVSLAGLKLDQAIDKIESIVEEQMIGIKSSISVGQLRTIRIFVLGEVNLPGSYVVGSLSTMTNAVFASGGITEVGTLRNVQLMRQGDVIKSLDLYSLLLEGDTSSDSRLLPGDVLFVPPVGETVSITGAVKRPARYELKGEKTVEEIINLAGGLMPTAFLPASKLERLSSNGEKKLVELEGADNGKLSQRIMDADIITIGDSLDLISAMVEIEGHTKREGPRPWKNGMTFTDILNNVDQLLPLPDLNLAIIERETTDTREIEVLSFSPKKAIASPKSSSDPTLQPRDKIRIFGFEESRTELLEDLVKRLKIQANFEKSEQTVRVDGSVRFPGTYPLSKKMTAYDLVLMAGGFSESALGREGEITRYDLNEDRERIITRQSVDFSGRIQNAFLVAGDTLRVQQIPLWEEKETVVLKGEFMHPGTYSLLPGETLMEVIERAGGLTSRAYASGAIFSRAELRELEAERLLDLKEKIESDIAAASLESSQTREEIDADQAEQILENIENTEAIGRLVIDLPAIFNNPDELDFQLTDGDIIEIPRFKPSVTVIGEVQYPTSHFFEPSLNVKAYLNRSGGLSRNADKKRIYVIKANGEVFQPDGNGWFAGRHSKLSPGDTIVVPLDTKKVDKLTLWASVTRIMYEAALGVAALTAL